MSEDSGQIEDPSTKASNNFRIKGPLSSKQRGLAKSTFKTQQGRIYDAEARATHDYLIPEIFNKRGFDEAAADRCAFALRREVPMYIVHIDGDRMKPVNDKYGHTIGDKIIRNLALSLAGEFSREEDVIGRLGGGDEFGIAASAGDPSEIEILLNSAREKYEQVAETIAPGSGASFSFGIAELGERVVEKPRKSTIDMIRAGNAQVGRFDPNESRPEIVYESALMAAEARMYLQKTERGTGRSD